MTRFGRLILSIAVSFTAIPLGLLAWSLRRRSRRWRLQQSQGSCLEKAGGPHTPRVLPWLQPELLDHIASFLPLNEVSATLRLVNRAASRHFCKRHHKLIKLVLPVPNHAFVHRWASPDAIRNLTLVDRIKLVGLTAASGSITNLKFLTQHSELALFTLEVFTAAAASGRLSTCRWLRRSTDCPWGEEVTEAAARAGHLRVCKWLIGQGCPNHLRRMLTAAAGAGNRDLCEWLIDIGAPLSGHGPRAAARSGHVDLMDLLLRPLSPERVGIAKLLVAVAEGCDLPTLQRIHAAYVGPSMGTAAGAGAGLGGGGRRRPLGRLDEPAASRLMAAAAGSSTPDWQAKVEWLRNLGYPLQASACERAIEAAVTTATASCGNKQAAPASRLAWLRQRGFPMDGWAALAAARRGDVECLRLVIDVASDSDADGAGRGGGAAATAGIIDAERVAEIAAAKGHLAVLQLLRERGCEFDVGSAVEAAARGGHVAAVTWLADKCTAPLTPRVFSAAAEAGSLGLMEDLRWRGCPWDANTFAWAAWVGCVQQLEWLARHGCPMGDDGEPYLWAGYNGDYTVLRCLRQLGCAWSPDGSTFTNAVCLQEEEEEPAAAEAGQGEGQEQQQPLAEGGNGAGAQPEHVDEGGGEDEGMEAGWWCSLDVLQWLVREGCPVDWAAAERVARRWRRGEEDLLQWIKTSRAEAQAAAEAMETKAAAMAAADAASAAEAIVTEVAAAAAAAAAPTVVAAAGATAAGVAVEEEAAGQVADPK